ncbi:MAG: hypothetical protein HPY66_1938 [Firmicutes bacterium]|nr:hypothetical protein [Bacillota bacterium]
MSKKTILIAIIMLLLASTGISAEGLGETIEIFRGNIRIVVDNTEVSLEEEPFIHNDRVYVPLRFVSSVLGKDVDWVPEARAVIISSAGHYRPLGECRPDLGEIFVYGEVKRVSYENFSVEIEQHFDDNSIEIENPLSFRQDAVIVFQGGSGSENLHFYQLRPGDTGGFILNSSGQVRGAVIGR